MDLGMDMKLAWRNVLRNKRRTFLAGLAVGIGLASLMFTDALLLGMTDNMIATATSSYLGEGQIHRKGFRATRDVDLTISRSDSVLAMLAQDPDVERFSARVVTTGMIQSTSNSTGILMVGVNPATEQELSQADDALVEGHYFDGSNARDILIGTELADLLDVEIGDRLVITAAQAHTGDLAQQMFRVSGIFHFNVTELDKSTAFVRLGAAQDMLALGSDIHEIAMTFRTSDVGRTPDHPVFAKYSQFDNEALGWSELLPQLEAALDLSQFSTLIVGLILFAVVALGIVNALFMSLYERMFEFGVMRAIGTHPAGMARLIVFEAGALAIISCVIGAIVGYAGISIAAAVGIDYTGIEFAGVTFRQLLYPVMQTHQFTTYPVAVVLFTLLVSFYPALFAARLTPSEAMRRSL